MRKTMENSRKVYPRVTVEVRVMEKRVAQETTKETTPKKSILGVQMCEIMINMIQEAGAVALPIQLTIMERSFRTVEAQVLS